jgi:hypothetical protein
MARTFLRQDTQIRRSDVYDDTVTPSLANYETNPTNIENDLNSVRSQLQNFLNRSGASFPVGNWWDDVSAPITFESGAKRGINELNQQLHDLERKRVLVCTANLIDVVVPAAAFATGILSASANFTNGETVTTGTKTYTFQTVLTNVDGNVLIGATASDSLDNLIAAINLGAGAGVVYAAATTANGFVSAAAGAGDTMNATALVAGTLANTYATTSVAVNASWGAATLTGGAGDVSVLTLGQLPANTTAAIGAVTTLGTVAANNPTFPNINLAEVGGSTAISPKNLAMIVDGSTRDPILSSSRRIYALFQTESSTDGSTMTGTTPNRAILSYVRLNSIGDDLEMCPASDIGGKTINYCSVTRKAMEALTEQDFLTGAETDVPSAATVTRQVAYDNQGTTPVDLTTNATLDLEGAGLAWRIRDDAQANLFGVIEGSAGGTSEIEFGSDVDFFDNNAADNDFLNGAKFDTGAASTTINVGVTANQIDSGGALTVTSAAATDLRLIGAAEMFLDDGNQTGSTWAQTNGIKLSDTTLEWDNFETAFGEVSLLRAIYMASQGGNATKTYANVTVTTVADTDVGGIAGGANLDAQLQDLSLGAFLTDYDVFLDGQLLRPGANAAANNDYYPGTSLVDGQLKFEFTVKVNDVVCVVARA